MIYERNTKTNYNNSNSPKKYSKLLNWINSIELPLCKTLYNVEDLKDGNIFIYLLKNFVEQNKQKYHLSLLDQAINLNTSIEKIKIILKIMKMIELPNNNNEIISRINYFQNNINHFIENDDLIMELVLYIYYLYQNKGNQENNDIDKGKTINSYKNNRIYTYDKKGNVKRVLKDFYDYNKYKRIIINNFLNKNEGCNLNKLPNNKELNYITKNIYNNLNIKNNNEKNKNINSNDLKNNSNIYKSKSFNKNLIKRNYSSEENNNNLNIENFNENNSISNYTIKSFINKKINLTDKNNYIFKKEQKSNFSSIKTDIKRNNSLNDLDKLNNNFVSSSCQLSNNKKINYNYIINNNIENNIENGKNNEEENKINTMDNNNFNTINKHNLIGIFKTNKLTLFKEEDELNMFKILKLSNPIIKENDNFKKLYPKLIKNKSLINKNESINQNVKNNFVYNNNLNNYLNNNKSKNKNIQQFSTLQNQKIANYSPLQKGKNIENYLINNSNKNSPVNLLMNLEEKKITRKNSYLIGMNKKINNNINYFNEDNKRLSFINSNKVNFSNSDIFSINNKQIKNQINKNEIFKIINNDTKNSIEKVKTINKNNIYNWILDLNIIKKEEVNIILLPTLVSDGILLCDIINSYEKEENKINKIIRKIISKEEALKNINIVLEYLKNLENFPKTHILDNELIFEIDDKAIWGLLYDLYNYYSKRTEKTKKNEDKINQLKKINYINNLNDKNKDLTRNNKKSSFENNKENYLYNNNNGNLKDYENENTYNSNLMSNSYNFYNINNIFYNNEYNKNNYGINITKKNNFDKNNDLSLINNKLSDNFDDRKGYFDYVNELKKHFDQNKNTKKSLYRVDIQKNNYLKISKNHPCFNEKLYYNYNDKLRLNNENNNDYPVESKYNYTDNCNKVK